VKRVQGSLPRLLAILGGRLRSLRHGAGLSGQDVWSRTGIDPGNLSRIENGKRVPTLQTLVALADLYEVPVAFLVDRSIVRGGEEAHVPPPEDSRGATADAQG